MVTDGAAGLELTQFDLVVRADDQCGRGAFEVAGHALLRGQDRRAVHTGLQLGVDEHARQQRVIRVREHGAQRHGASSLVNRNFGELQLAVEFVLAAVFEGQLDGRGVVAGLLQATGFQVTAQLQQLYRGLGHVDVDRVELLDHGHRLGLGIADQRAFGDRRSTDTTGQWRVDLGVAHIDLGRLQRGFRLQAVGHGRVVFLAAHGLFVDQLLVAIGNRLGRTQVGFGAFLGRFIDRWIDLIQLLAGLDVAAFLEQTLENDAVDLRTNLGNAVRAGAPRQIRGERKRLRLKGDDADLRRWCGRWSFFLFASAEQRCQGDGGDQSGNSWLELHENPRVRRARSALERWKVEKCLPSG
ncbi:hypothetical protein D3C81_718830 [compost metagenome]